MDKVFAKNEISGEIMICASKSVMHRALICAALSDKPTRIICNGSSEDILATINCLRNMSAVIEESRQKDVKIYDVQPIVKNICQALDCSESGSTLRFLICVNAALGVDTYFKGHGRLLNRPIKELLSELERHGVKCLQTSDEIKISGKLEPGEYHLPGNITSQYVSGLLMALPLLDGESKIILDSEPESAEYIDLTIDVLESFGINILKVNSREYNVKKQNKLFSNTTICASFETTGSDCLYAEKTSNNQINSELLTEKDEVSLYRNFVSPNEYYVEGDWSNAAFWLVAGALAAPEGLIVSGLNMDSIQPDKRIVDILKLMEAEIEISKDTKESKIIVKKSKLKGIDVNARNIPDLVPAIAVAAACASGRTIIRDVSRLQLKESDRIESVINMINSLGGKAYLKKENTSKSINPIFTQQVKPIVCEQLEEASTDNLDSSEILSIVIDGTDELRGGIVDSYNDHRIVMAGIVASLICKNQVTMKEAQAVKKSYPEFFEIFESHLRT